jgi:hypothetical protein
MLIDKTRKAIDLNEDTGCAIFFNKMDKEH